MDQAFKVHMLNERGKQRAKGIADAFDRLQTNLVRELGLTDKRCEAIVRTKLEEACFFAKKGMALDRANQQDG